MVLFDRNFKFSSLIKNDIVEICYKISLESGLHRECIIDDDKFSTYFFDEDVHPKDVTSFVIVFYNYVQTFQNFYDNKNYHNLFNDVSMHIIKHKEIINYFSEQNFDDLVEKVAFIFILTVLYENMEKKKRFHLKISRN